MFQKAKLCKFSSSTARRKNAYTAT